MLPQRAAAAVRRAAFRLGRTYAQRAGGPDARTFTTLGEDVAHRPARGRRSHQPNLGLRPRPLPGGHCSLSAEPPLLAHREILIPQGTSTHSAACWNCRIPSVPLDPLTHVLDSRVDNSYICIFAST